MAGKPGASGIKGGTTLTPERLERLITALRQGDTRTGACLYAGVSVDVLARWMRANTANAEQITNAEAERKIEALAVVRKAAQSGTWQAAAWLLERRYPDEFGLRSRIDLATVRDEAGILGSKIGIGDTDGLVQRADEIARGLGS